MRLLNSLRVIAWLNVLFILVAVFVTLGAFSAQGQAESLAARNATIELVNPKLDVFGFYGAMSLFAFAYAGGLFEVIYFQQTNEID